MNPFFYWKVLAFFWVLNYFWFFGSVLLNQPTVHSRWVVRVRICGSGCWWQVTGDKYQVTGDGWQVTGDRWHVTHDYYIYIYIYNYFCFIFRWLYFGVGTTIRFLKPEFWESTYFYFGLKNFQCSGPYLARPIKKGLFMPSYCRTPDLPIPAIPINDWKGMERLYTM